MFYVYVLKSQKDNLLYVGYTSDLKSRIFEHNSGKVFSTRSCRPLDLFYYEAGRNEKDALKERDILKPLMARDI